MTDTALEVWSGDAFSGIDLRVVRERADVLDNARLEPAQHQCCRSARCRRSVIATVAPVTDEVGLGPWEGDWPDDPRLDPELLAAGDRRNVVDRYRYWRLEAIVADLDRHRHPFHVAIENWQHDLNIGSVIRTANAFLAAEVHIVGRRRWNRRGAMVTDRYQHVRHHPDIAGLTSYAATLPLGGDPQTPALRHEGLRMPLIGVDNLPGAVPLETYDLPRDCVLLFGQEGPGLTADAHHACDVVLSIAQYGSTRSINASAAAAIAMHAWIRRWVFRQRI